MLQNVDGGGSLRGIVRGELLQEQVELWGKAVQIGHGLLAKALPLDLLRWQRPPKGEFVDGRAQRKHVTPPQIVIAQVVFEQFLREVLAVSL